MCLIKLSTDFSIRTFIRLIFSNSHSGLRHRLSFKLGLSLLGLRGLILVLDVLPLFSLVPRIINVLRESVEGALKHERGGQDGHGKRGSALCDAVVDGAHETHVAVSSGIRE